GLIAGCQITEGIVKRGSLVRQLRGKEIIWKGKIGSLKRGKDDVKEVKEGFECGILLEGQSDIKEGDILQVYEISYLEQDL
ncbi:MAG TPA: EF-Tu/IF-2/RF-3 family GTPase, partial [Chlamydiales bacterium]|nr:EF-Tu/IF-2/RF-3 family GTPase [Chlamydiales bacterium]